MKILYFGYNDSKATEAVLKVAHQHGLAFKADVFIVTSMEQSPTLKKEDIDKAESKLEKPENLSGQMISSVRQARLC